MDSLLYKIYQEMEESHWWFLARHSIFIDILDKTMNSFQNLAVLDIGCATGAMLDNLDKYGKVTGIDASKSMVDYVNNKGRRKIYLGKLPENIPFEENRFDLITLLDVLEHINDDITALEVVFNLLKNDGILLCSVPAFRFLWTNHDEVNHHKRRYTLKELESKLIKVGFHIKKISYFNAFLFLPIFIVRQFNKINAGAKNSDFSLPNPVVNKLLTEIFAFEKHLLRFLSLPFGVSLLAVVQKVKT